jgi:thioredoxin-related protein
MREAAMAYIDKKFSALLSRRTFVAGGASFLGGIASAYALPKLDPDGLYREPWLTKTSGNLSVDFAAATKTGKNFVLLWEMRGCGWCKRLHLENFAQAGVAAYLQANFSMIQLNLRGKREIADFDGTKLTEEGLSYKLGVNSTPTFQFFRPSDTAAHEELGRMGYVKPEDFLAMLHFIREKGYEMGSFEDWAKSRKNPG